MGLDMTSKEIEKDLQDLDLRESQLNQKYKGTINLYKEFDKQRTEIYDSRRKLRIQLTETKLDESPSDIAFLLKYDPTAGTIKSHNVLDKVAKQHGLRHGGGAWSKTSQFVIRIQLNHHQSCQEALEGVIFFLPYITPDEKGYAHFDIFEHTLSEYGSYSLKVHKTTHHAVIELMNHYRGSEYFSGSLEDALHKISENLWYE